MLGSADAAAAAAAEQDKKCRISASFFRTEHLSSLVHPAVITQHTHRFTAHTAFVDTKTTLFYSTTAEGFASSASKRASLRLCISSCLFTSLPCAGSQEDTQTPLRKLTRSRNAQHVADIRLHHAIVDHKSRHRGSFSLTLGRDEWKVFVGLRSACCVCLP